MSKRPKRWPIWKITCGGIACVIAAVVLFSLSVYIGRNEALAEASSGLLTLAGFVMVLGMGASMLVVVFCIWLGVRIKEARTPPWERKGKSKRR